MVAGRVMAAKKVKILGYRCKRCEHEWLPRLAAPPLICPKCKSAYWDRRKKKS
jgi:predicted Zn-ribbon and HTH transcriptional regulator